MVLNEAIDTVGGTYAGRYIPLDVFVSAAIVAHGRVISGDQVKEHKVLDHIVHKLRSLLTHSFTLIAHQDSVVRIWAGNRRIVAEAGRQQLDTGPPHDVDHVDDHLALGDHALDNLVELTET